MTSIPSGLARGLSLLLLLAALVPAHSSAEVTAAYALETGGASYGSFGNQTLHARGQVFTATVAGNLASISVRAGRNSDHGVDLILSIYAEDAGLPVGDPLASRTLAASAIPEGGTSLPVGADFTGSGVSLEEETQYVIVAVPASLDPESSLYFLNGVPEAQADYSGGASCFLLGDSWTVGGTVWSFQVEVGESTPTREERWGAIKKLFLDLP